MGNGASAGGDEPHRARHAGTAEATVARGVLREVLLVIVLGVVKRRSGLDLRGDRRRVTRLLQRRLIRVARSERGLLLCLRERVDARAVLRARVVPLAHALGGIVVLP